ncbi:HAD family hydrolase [Streptomyces odontomachi]|uniref:HAD family hydrolase n=1 Tax=Streptomyces odontomachi TaxID=2944940 RepID=UPI00210DA592|nr:HAD hydrolase-like protein [Streptomyces sp. ODS25]
MPPPLVCFDLDLTLVDSTPAVAAVLTSAARSLTLPVDVAAVVAGLGPALEDLLGAQLQPSQARRLARAYRDRYALEGPRHARTLPGAHAALRAVRTRHGAVMVVTGQRERTARAHLAHARLDVDAVAGSVWGPEKTEILRARGAFAYVGDHPADIAAAHAADVWAVGVTSGRHDAADLAAADAVLPSLTAFPNWWERVRPMPRRT